MSTEVEVRAFISDGQYSRLLDFFKMNAKLIADDEQETHYLSGGKDLRIQRNKRHAKIWMKKGKIHDDHREEIEILTEKENFPGLERLFLELGHVTEIKWFRKRKEYFWGDITACLDDTKGYGKIIELEKKAKDSEKIVVLEYLKGKMNELDIELTPREEFDSKYAYYKTNWKKLTE
jgi:predicted adenylyl cyclase CyaB